MFALIFLILLFAGLTALSMIESNNGKCCSDCQYSLDPALFTTFCAKHNKEEIILCGCNEHRKKREYRTKCKAKR